MQLQLSLTLADDLYDLLLIRGEPLDYVETAHRLLSLRGAPDPLCRSVMDTLVRGDRRFCWSSPTTLGLLDWKLADPDLADVPFVVVDLETTGTRPGLGKITEIGAVRIEGLCQVAEFETLVNPQRPILPKVIEITGITPRMVAGAPRIEEVMPHFLDFLRDAVIVAHNALFDLSFLNYELTRLKGRRLGEGAIDTVLLARQMAPGLPNYRLGTVAYALGSPVASCHRALADAQATAHVFLTLIGRLQEQGVTRLNQARSTIDPAHRRDRHKVALTRDLPRAPGAYLFLDEDGQVLYVGKADRLRDRVRSYFVANPGHPRKVRQAVRRLRKVTWQETGSSLEAVVREQELILEHRPPCNVQGRKPETYVYLKAAGKDRGMRLYASDRPGGPKGLMLGPFRGRTRVLQAVELLRRSYPLRQCVNSSTGPVCLYGQTGRCLSPCRGEESRDRHDRLLVDLLTWVAGGAMPDDGDPLERGRQVMADLSRQRRFEEAQAARDAVDHVAHLRRAYAALEAALDLRTAVLWPDPTDASAARLNLVWHGKLVAAQTLTSANGSLEVGRLLRSLSFPQEGPQGREGEGRDNGHAPGASSFGGIAVAQEELDGLLAVRRWFLENPGIKTLPCPVEGTPSHRIEHWRRIIVAELDRLLST